MTATAPPSSAGGGNAAAGGGAAAAGGEAAAAGGGGAAASSSGSGGHVAASGGGHAAAPAASGGEDTLISASSARESTTPYRVAARRLLHDSLFDASRRLLADRPWARISMAEVAREAGVSRQTLYKEFGSRDEFAQQFVIREGARFLDAVERAILEQLDDPSAAVAGGLEVFLTLASQDPLMRMLLDDDGTGGMLPLLTTQSRPVLEWATARLCQVMRSGWPHVEQRDAELLADTFVRLAISYVTMPSRPPAETAVAVAALLTPYLEGAVVVAG